MSSRDRSIRKRTPHVVPYNGLSPDRGDGELLFLAGDFQAVFFGLFFAEELGAEGRFRSDDQNFALFENDFGAAGARADEVEIFFAAAGEFDDGAGVDGFAGGEFARGHFFEFLDGLLDFGDLAGLAAREIGSFKAASVVFVFGFALFVGGLGASGDGGAMVQAEVGL